MISNDINEIKKAANAFLSENQENFEIINTFRELLINLTEESYNETIQLIKNHSDVFFKEHSSAFSFVYIVAYSLPFNFLKLELILDIVIAFSIEIRNSGITDNELFKIFNKYQISINYLFYKNFFTTDLITEYSYFDDLTFIKFLPEIKQYDSEYVILRQKKLNFSNKKSLQSLFEYVQKNPEQHIKNRNINYHPSALHMSIRNDDIETFQSILSKNNFTINHKIEFSYYERAQMIDSDLSLIQVAVTYSAMNIFKFLWMQNDIVLNDNLLIYAFFSGNPEIIHLFENKFSHEDVILQTIYMNRYDLLNYYIENFSDKIVENDEMTKEALKKIGFEKDEENLYDVLNIKDLCGSVHNLSIPIIQSCLYKIVFLVNNVDTKRNLSNNQHLIISSMIHFDLFKFLYSQRVEDDFESILFFSLDCLNASILNGSNDSFKFLLKLEKLIDLKVVFTKCLQYNIEMANYLLDIQIDEVNDSSNEEKRFFYRLNYIMKITHLVSVICNSYNENVIVKMIKLYDFFKCDENIKIFVSYLLKNASVKMISSLFSKLYSILPKDILLKMASYFEEFKCFVISEAIKKKYL